MTEYTVSMTKERFASFYKDLSRDTSLIRTLAEMQSGVTDRKAYEIADQMIRDVAAFEGTLDAVREDTTAVVDAFLQESIVLNTGDRMENLHKLHFGLTVYNNPDSVEDEKEGATYADLFSGYMTHSGSLTEQELTDRIRHQLLSLSVSPEIMEALVKKLETGDSLMADAVSVGADSLRFKAVLAMQLYEDHKAEGMTTAEAAALACSSMEVQQIAEAAGQGMMTRDKALALINGVAMALLLFSLLCNFPFFLNFMGKLAVSTVAPGMTVRAVGLALYRNNLIPLLAGYALLIFDKPLARLAGMASANYHFSRDERKEAVLTGLRQVADAAKEKFSALKNRVRPAADTAQTAPVLPVSDLSQSADEDTEPAIAF